MKRLSLLLCCVIICSSFVHTQEESSPKSKEVMISGGIAYPYLPKDFRDSWNKGWNLGLGYGYSFAPGSIGYGAIFASFEFNHFDMDPAKYVDNTPFKDTISLAEAGNASSGGNVNAFSVMINVKGVFSPTKQSIAPYFLLGIGYVNVAQQGISVTPDTTFDVARASKSSFAWSFGIGVEVPFSQSAAFYVQGKSLLVVVDPTRQYFPVSAGLRLRW